jgi:hypothetical protein
MGSNGKSKIRLRNAAETAVIVLEGDEGVSDSRKLVRSKGWEMVQPDKWVKREAEHIVYFERLIKSLPLDS